MKWKIYYEDSSTYCDLDGPVFDAPGNGVIAIAQEHPIGGRQILAKNNHYWWRGEKIGWLYGDLFGMYDYQIIKGPQKVIHGRMTTNNLYQDIIKKVLEDNYLPQKTTKILGETY